MSTFLSMPDLNDSRQVKHSQYHYDSQHQQPQRPGYQVQNASQPPPRQKTQQDQDEDDDKKRKQAMKDLTQSWMDKLQLISVITTFFAANEAQLLSITTPGSGGGAQGGQGATPTQDSANAGIVGALILHSFSAVLAFVGAFVLIRYRLASAKKEEAKEEGKPPKDDDENHLWSSNPHLEPITYFGSKNPPIHLLERFFLLTLWIAGVGFVFGAWGCMCLAWSMQSKAVGIFASACLGLCVLSAAVLVLWNPKGL